MSVDDNLWFKTLWHSICVAKFFARSVEVSYDESFEYFRKILDGVKNSGAYTYVIGNGGSCSIASHISEDILNHCGIRSVALSDGSLITCFANDYGFENVYRKSLGTLLYDNNALVVVSTSSGNSPNLIKAVELAIARKIRVIALTSFSWENRLNTPCQTQRT
ncbi:MAG: SIS domain-containing protein [Rickettsiales bacterium]|jgi:D-sedoheptulose 7-phosphate isomerase|nr:SIS domain-containing protein [Rickettsiales bacterium]